MIRPHYPPPAVAHQTGRRDEPMTMRRLKPLATVALAGLLAAAMGGCVYKVNIAQGNYLEAKTIDQVAAGMTRSQVRFLLGTPMISDPFHPEQWDYLYYFKTGKTQKVERHRIVIYFADDKVTKVDHPDGAFKDPQLPTSVGA